MNILEKSKKLRAILPYVPVLIAFFYALYFWQKGWVEPARIFGVIGLGLILLGILLRTVRQFIQDDRYVVIIGSVLLIFMGLYCWIGREIPYTGIFGALIGVSLIFNTVLEGTWKNICGGAVLVLAVIVLIVGEIKGTMQDEVSTVEQAAQVQQGRLDKASEPSDVPSGEPSASTSLGQSMTDMMDQFLTPEQRENPIFQKVMKVVESDSFQKQMQEQDPRTPQEFIDLMTAHGLTEFSGIDYSKVMADAHAMAIQDYQAANPGKDPKDEDEAMAKRIGEMLKTADPTSGIMKMVQDREISLWIAARFQGDQGAFSEWLMPLLKGSVSTGSAKSPPTPTDFEFPDAFLFDSTSDEPVEQAVIVEAEPSLSDPLPTSTREESTIPSTEHSSAAAPTVEPGEILTEMSPEPPAPPMEEALETALRERFSPERFERLMSTLERYGPEEGLRRLREDDPEIAKQVERHRSKGNPETDSQ